MTQAKSRQKELYRNYIEEIFNQRQLNKIDLYLNHDYQLREAPPGFKSGRQAVISIVEMFKLAFPDFTIILDDVIEENDCVACRSTFTGTHQGEFLGVQPTHNTIRFTSLTLVKFRDNKIIESWVRNDMDGLKNQLLS